jgi:hypothetical protein
MNLKALKFSVLCYEVELCLLRHGLHVILIEISVLYYAIFRNLTDHCHYVVDAVPDYIVLHLRKQAIFVVTIIRTSDITYFP